MKLLKTEKDDGSTMKSTIRYTFVAPGAIGKGRGRGLKSLAEKGHIQAKKLLFQSNDLVDQYMQENETSSIGKTKEQGLKSSTMSTSQGIGAIHMNSMALEKDMTISTPTPTSTNQVKKYTKEVKKRAVGKELEQRLESTMSSKGTRSNSTLLSNQEM